MSEPTLTPGMSLESDLKLIREARGISREEIFNRVHIRPEVLEQVEEHGFGATPTLSSDIHRRSFVKHFADAVEIDADFALAALTKSLTGFYDGSLAVEYLDLEELKSIPRWAQQADETPADTEVKVNETPADTEARGDETLGDTEARGDETLGDTEAEVNETPATVDFDVVPSEPEIPAAEAPILPPLPSPYAPPSGTSVTAEPSEEAAPLDSSPKTPRSQTPEPQTLEHVTPPAGRHESVPDAPSAGQVPNRRETSNIPSSTLKESVIGPPDESDFGDQEGFWSRLRNRHWLTWLGLAGVVVVLLVLVQQAFFVENKSDPEPRTGVASAADLPDQFSGVVRLTPTTERFVTLQIHPDSLSQTKFFYKMWTHNAGSTYAETGEGSLNIDENQILFGEPYGLGGVFLQEGGAISIRSVRRIRFPRWEFTGQNE